LEEVQLWLMQMSYLGKKWVWHLGMLKGLKDYWRICEIWT
jgi:hypothetical protein